MSEDRRVPPLADRDVRNIAFATKQAYGTAKRRPVNIIRCLESGWIPTRRGRQTLDLKVVSDDEMDDKDGRTDFTENGVIIFVKKSIRELANWGDGRARMTLAHELGHGVMHRGGTMFRVSAATGTTELSRRNASESAEHQAKVFAPAFLIDDDVAATLASAEDISTEFLVSLEAARICFGRMVAEAERARSAERVRLSNEAFQALMRKQAPQTHYTGDPCVICGGATLIPMGIKLMCHTCGNVSDPN